MAAAGLQAGVALQRPGMEGAPRLINPGALSVNPLAGGSRIMGMRRRAGQ